MVILLLTSLIEVGLLSLVSTTFVIIYKVRAGTNWRSIPEGRHLMRFSIALCITFWATFLSKLAALLIPSWSTYIFYLFNHRFEVVIIALFVEVFIFGALLIELINRVRLVLQGNGND